VGWPCLHAGEFGYTAISGIITLGCAGHDWDCVRRDWDCVSKVNDIQHTLTVYPFFVIVQVLWFKLICNSGGHGLLVADIMVVSGDDALVDGAW
jgi:hypothetical protein